MVVNQKKKYRDEASKRLNNLALDAEYYGLLDEPKTLGGTIIDGELGIQWNTVVL